MNSLLPRLPRSAALVLSLGLIPLAVSGQDTALESNTLFASILRTGPLQAPSTSRPATHRSETSPVSALPPISPRDLQIELSGENPNVDYFRSAEGQTVARIRWERLVKGRREIRTTTMVAPAKSIPEPGTILLGAFGVVVLLTLRRRPARLAYHSSSAKTLPRPRRGLACLRQAGTSLAPPERPRLTPPRHRYPAPSSSAPAWLVS